MEKCNQAIFGCTKKRIPSLTKGNNPNLRMSEKQSNESNCDWGLSREEAIKTKSVNDNKCLDHGVKCTLHWHVSSPLETSQAHDSM